MLFVPKSEAPHLLLRLQRAGATIKVIEKDSVSNLRYYEIIDNDTGIIIKLRELEEENRGSSHTCSG